MATQQAKKPQAQAVKPSAAKTPTQAVAATKPTAVATVPDYIKQGAGRGNENVEMSDYVIPRIEVVQALSPCLKSNDPSYIEDASQGDLYNSVTRELYGNAVTVIPVVFRKEYLVWKDRTKGGGFRGAYPSMQEAQARIDGEKDGADLVTNETAQQFVLIVREDGTMDEAVVSMSKTKLKISRQWNSLIRINGNDRFSRTYVLSSTEDNNEKGDFYNFAVANAGFPTVEQYKRAESLFEAIASGARRVVADTSDGDLDGQAQARGEY
jgi:hypothetical protein